MSGESIADLINRVTAAIQEIESEGNVVVGSFPDGKFSCDCGRPIQLWWNGGELDQKVCLCGVTWRGEHVDALLVKKTTQ